jgi:hypothetical protein
MSTEEKVGVENGPQSTNYRGFIAGVFSGIAKLSGRF